MPCVEKIRLQLVLLVYFTMATNWLDFSEIKVFEDDVDDATIMKTIIRREKRMDAFYILNIDQLVERHRNWIRKMPRIIPHYAVKCNPDSTVVKILAALNAGFDCASEREIIETMRYGVSGERIILANPAKAPSDISFARRMGVEKMTADSETELLKIKNLFPNAKIRCHSMDSPPVTPGEKFGCDPQVEAIRLIELAKELGLTVHGFSFHAGSPCNDMASYARGIRICEELIGIAGSMGCADAKLIDIGGGFPGETDTENQIETLAGTINEAIGDIDRSIRIISEPGRYYVTSPFTLAAQLHTRKLVAKGDRTVRMYYVNCGVYSSFIEELLHLKSRHPISLFNMTLPRGDNDKERYVSTIWGPTCDAYDCIVEEALLPEFHVGDWLIWRDMGAYTLSLACPFNGFPPPTVYPIIRRSQWRSLLRDLTLTEIDDNAEYVDCCQDFENVYPPWETKDRQHLTEETF